MAGLLGALVAGGVQGYTGQRLKDIDEQEEFDYKQRLQQSDFQMRTLLTKMGFDQQEKMADKAYDRDSEMADKNYLRDIEKSDYNRDNAIKLKEKEIELTNNQAQQERDERAKAYDTENPYEGTRKNFLKMGFTDEAGKVPQPEGKKPFKLRDNENLYDADGNLLMRGGDDDGGTGNSRSSKKTDKGWNETTRQTQEQISKSIDAIMGDPAMLDDQQKQRAVEAKSLGGQFYQFNQETPIERIAEVANYASSLPKEQRFFIKEMPDGTKYKIRGVAFDGGEYPFSDKLQKIMNETKDASPKKTEKKGLINNLMQEGKIKKRSEVN